LGLLEREPSHGYDLKRDYDTFFGRGRPLPFGQVYSTLGRLARDGKDVISELGATEVDAWLAQPVEPEPHLQTVLFSKVMLSLMLDRPAHEYLDTQRAAHLKRMRELHDIKKGDDLIEAMLADHGLFHLEADLRWIELTVARLDHLAGLVKR